MKRHPVLHKLTEDHHHGLIQVRHLREATIDTIAGRTRAFLTRWRSEINPHFQEEELALLPFVCPPVDPEAPEIREMLAQHIRLRRLVLELQRAHGADDDAAKLEAGRAIAELLDAHIRLEEREVFELIQEKLDDDQLTALGVYLVAWETAAAAGTTAGAGQPPA